MAQLKGDKLMVVPSTADGFRAAISALRSLDGEDGVSFHTFTIPEDRCARILVKNLGRGMPESVVREELPPLRWLLYPAGPACVLWLRGKPHSELPWLC